MSSDQDGRKKKAGKKKKADSVCVCALRNQSGLIIYQHKLSEN